MHFTDHVSDYVLLSPLFLLRSEMSSKTKWIRIFQISETKTHKSYTVYKVTCTTFPINCPEQANTVTTWKR